MVRLVCIAVWCRHRCLSSEADNWCWSLLYCCCAWCGILRDCYTPDFAVRYDVLCERREHLLHPRLRSCSRKVRVAVSRVGGWCRAQPGAAECQHPRHYCVCRTDPPLVSKLHILHMSVDTVPVATNHGGTARQCNPLDLLAYPSYMMLQYAPVRCGAGHVLADISNINTSGRGPWRPGAGVVGAGWVAPLPPVPFFLWYRHCWRCTLCA